MTDDEKEKLEALPLFAQNSSSEEETENEDEVIAEADFASDEIVLDLPEELEISEEPEVEENSADEQIERQSSSGAVKKIRLPEDSLQEDEVEEALGLPPEEGEAAFQAGDISNLLMRESFGPIFGELRRRAGISIEELAEDTKIRSIYLEAIENEDFNDLPPLTYVIAYLRMLSKYYGLSKEQSDAITEVLREQQDYEPPEDIGKHVRESEISEENIRRLRHIKYIISGGALLLVLIVILAVYLVMRVSSSDEGELSAPARETLTVEEVMKHSSPAKIDFVSFK